MARTSAALRAAVLGALLALSWGCGQDPVEALKQARPQAVAPHTLGQALAQYPFFSRVSWSATPDRQGRRMVRATGIYNLELLAGRAEGGRGFSAADKAALDKAGANLCYVVEYSLDSKSAQAERVFAAVMIVTMDWSQSAPLADDALLREIALGQAGAATLKAAGDAAAYSRARMAVEGARKGS